MGVGGVGPPGGFPALAHGVAVGEAPGEQAEGEHPEGERVPTTPGTVVEAFGFLQLLRAGVQQRVVRFEMVNTVHPALRGIGDGDGALLGIGDQDVARLQVAVADPDPVKEGQGLRDLPDDRPRHRRFEGLVEPVLQRPRLGRVLVMPAVEIHHHPVGARVEIDRVPGNHAGMAAGFGEPGLGSHEEPSVDGHGLEELDRPPFTRRPPHGQHLAARAFTEAGDDAMAGNGGEGRIHAGSWLCSVNRRPSDGGLSSVPAGPPAAAAREAYLAGQRNPRPPRHGDTTANVASTQATPCARPGWTRTGATPGCP